MAPPRPATFEQPDLQDPAAYKKDFLPFLWRLFRALPKSRFQDRLNGPGQFWSMVFRSTFQDDEDLDDEWHPHAVLGQGAFGAVGAFKRRSPETGEVIDELAVKTIHVKSEFELDQFTWSEGPEDSDLLSEAVIQKHLNDFVCENIVHLRGYKCFHRADTIAVNRRPGPPVPMGREYKLYLEHAPFDTLDALRLRYRYHHQYLPEPFLWHVFDSLACALTTMSRCRQTGFPLEETYGKPTDTVGLVHFDIKLKNILLGYPEPYTHNKDKYDSPHALKNYRGGTRRYDYPTVKLADFGLAAFVPQDEKGTIDPRNPEEWLSHGTPAERPPEQVHYGARWSNPPNGPYNGLAQTNWSPFERRTGQTNVGDDITDDPRNLNFQLSEKGDVWAIGKVMFDLMGLHHSSKLWRLATRRFDRYERFRDHMIANCDRVPFAKYRVNRRSPYTSDLTKLVWECLRPNIEDRVDLAKVATITATVVSQNDHQYQDGCEASLRTPGDVRHPKLFWRRDEINHMPVGPENFSNAFAEYIRMQKGTRSDPDWPHLRPSFDRYTGPPDNRSHHDRYLIRYESRNWRQFNHWFKVVNDEVHLRDRQDRLPPEDANSDYGDDDDDFYFPQDDTLPETDDEAGAESGTDGPEPPGNPNTNQGGGASFVTEALSDGVLLRALIGANRDLDRARQEADRRHNNPTSSRSPSEEGEIRDRPQKRAREDGAERADIDKRRRLAPPALSQAPRQVEGQATEERSQEQSPESVNQPTDQHGSNEGTGTTNAGPDAEESEHLWEVLQTGNSYAVTHREYDPQEVLGLGHLQNRTDPTPAPAPAAPVVPTWTAEYTQAFALAVARSIPAIPADVDPADDTFQWDATQGYGQERAGLFIRTVNNIMYVWDETRQRWKEPKIYVNNAKNRELGRAGLFY